MTEMPGRFITFEGADGSGKTTQMKLLAARLTALGYEVVETQEPGGTDIGLQIRKILLDAENSGLAPTAEMLLYFAARAQNFSERILPAWKGGAIVLSDRFTDSTLAYQGAGRGLDTAVVMNLHQIACAGVQPNLTLCIDLDLETALQRVHARNEETAQRDRMDEQSEAFHRRVLEGYRALSQQHPERIKLVDGHGSFDQVSDRVWEIVSRYLPHQASNGAAHV
jgi:dTMP kinase